MENPKNERYLNPDNDPRGPWAPIALTMQLERPMLRYEWNGLAPRQGTSWRFSKATMEELARDGRLYYPGSKLPALKRYLYETSAKLFEFLSRLPSKRFKLERDFISYVIPGLAEALGYGEFETFYGFGGPRYHADAIFSEAIDVLPWIVIEARKTRVIDISNWSAQLRWDLQENQCGIGVMISLEGLLIVTSEYERFFNLGILTREQAQEIYSLLDRTAQKKSIPRKGIKKNHLVELIEDVESASTNTEKGKSLETLASYLFSNISSLHCKYRNMNTRSSEIDIVVEYNKSKGFLPLFEELGRYCLVECKNWSSPIGAKEVRDFIGKLKKCRIGLGIIFSRFGITGMDSGADAVREIQTAFDRDGVFVIFFSIEDIRSLESGKNFSDVIDIKADQLRFDL